MKISAKETSYFYREGEALLQAAEMMVEGMQDSARLTISVEADGQKRSDIVEGYTLHHSYTVLLPAGAKCAIIRVQAGLETAEVKINAGNFRPWTIYVAQDKHLDYGWKHPVEEIMMRINRLTDYYLDANAAQGTRFNMDCTLWLTEYLRARPGNRVEELIRLLREGTFQMGAFDSVLFNGILTEDEMIHALAAARKYEREYGIPAKAVMPNEAPCMNWGMAQVLCGAGVKYIVRGAYDLNNANIKNREPHPLFWWEGPDGSRVLTKFDMYEETRSFGGYAEAYTLRVGSYAERMRFVERAVERYEQYESYPFDSILLAGTGWDEYPFTLEVNAFIDWYNNQGWAYPRLVDATWQEYFDRIELEPEKLAALPILRGDFGSAWEEWPAQLAYLNAIFRNARRLASDARSLCALVTLATGCVDKARDARLCEAFTYLCRFADHNIGGIQPFEAYDTRDRKTQWVYCAQKLASEALESSLAELSERFSCVAGSLLVSNPLSFCRSGIVEYPLMEEIGQLGHYRVTDANTGTQTPCQVLTRGAQPEHYLLFVARDVPGFGCKVFRVEKTGDKSMPRSQSNKGSMVLENKRFRLEVDVVNGGLSSLVDKVLNRELADRESPYQFNQYLYTSETTQHSLRGVKVLQCTQGSVCSSITVEGRSLHSYIRTTYTIYESLDVVDVENYLEKEPSSELQTCHFVFPFAVQGREYHYDGTAAILKPGDKTRYGGDALPGAALGSYCGLHFADVSNDVFGVTLCSRDTHLYHFGANTMGLTEGYIDPNNATVWSVAIENYNRNDWALNQGGQNVFIFRYRIAPHSGGFDACKALQTGLDAFHPFQTFSMGRSKNAAISVGEASWLDVVGEGVFATAKNGEEGGLVLRLRNVLDKAVSATVFVKRAGSIRAQHIDHLEREGIEILCEGSTFVADVPALGLISVKITTDV